MDRRLAAILAADVASYSRLMSEDETGTLAALQAHRSELIEPSIVKHRARIVKLMGDGILAERLLHERQVALHAVANSVRDWLGSLADQYVVGSWGGAGADTEQRIERGMPCSAPIEAEHELVEVVLEVGSPQSVVNAQAPALEI